MTDHSPLASIPGVVAASAIISASSSSDEIHASLLITESIVSYLRTEADQAEDKAKRLRKQAAEIAQQLGITLESQQAYDVDPNELPPLDETGLPKYKGKKRGRKPKMKKRKTNPDRPKRKHTGYTLFMQEVYPTAKSEYPDLPSKELISLVASRWKELEVEGKTAWKERARLTTEGHESRGPTDINLIRNDKRLDTAEASSSCQLATSKSDENLEIKTRRNQLKEDMDRGPRNVSRPDFDKRFREA